MENKNKIEINFFNKINPAITLAILLYGVLDLLTTYLAIEFFSGEERNWFTKIIYQNFPATWIVLFIIIKVMVLSIAIICYHKFSLGVPVKLLIALGIYVTILNISGIVVNLK